MSIEFTVSERIERPPEAVFRGMTDLDGADAWMPGLVRIERRDEGPLREGSVWRETRKLFGKEATEEFEVTNMEAPRSLELRVDGSKGTSKRGEYLFRYELRPVDGGTEVQLDGEIRGLSGPWSWVGRFMAGPYKKACARDLRELRHHLESGA